VEKWSEVVQFGSSKHKLSNRKLLKSGRCKWLQYVEQDQLFGIKLWLLRRSTQNV